MTDTRGRTLEADDWRDVVRLFSSHRRCASKDGVPLVGFFELHAGTTRAARNVLRVHVGVWDLDHGDRAHWERSRALLKGIACVVSSTWSHKPGAPKLRLALLLSRPVTAEEWVRLWPVVNARFELHADSKSSDASRIFYVPSCPPGAEPYVWTQEGAALDVDDVLRHAPPVPAKPARTGLEWFTAIEQIPEGKRDSTLASLAGRLFRSDLPPELSFSILRAVNEARCVPPLSDAQVEKIASSIASREAAR